MRLLLGAFLNHLTHRVPIELNHEVAGRRKVAQLAKTKLQRDLVCFGGHELLQGSLNERKRDRGDVLVYVYMCNGL